MICWPAFVLLPWALQTRGVALPDRKEAINHVYCPWTCPQYLAHDCSVFGKYQYKFVRWIGAKYQRLILYAGMRKQPTLRSTSRETEWAYQGSLRQKPIQFSSRVVLPEPLCKQTQALVAGKMLENWTVSKAYPKKCHFSLYSRGCK